MEESPKIEDRECEVREAAQYTFIFCALLQCLDILKPFLLGERWASHFQGQPLEHANRPIRTQPSSSWSVRPEGNIPLP